MDESSSNPDLRNAREARGWTLKQVAERLHITEIQVQGLEEGNYAVLPGATFARGFLKNYARILDLDPEPLLRNYDAANAGSGISPTRQLLPDGESPLLDYSKRTLLISFLILIAVIVAVWWFWGRSESPSTVVPENSSHSASMPATLAEPAISNTAPTASVQSVVVATRSQAVSSSSPVTATAQSAATSSTVTSSTTAGIAFQFHANCWVQVRDAAGKTLLAVLGRPGDLLKVNSGKPPYQVLVGNAQGVTIHYQGKAIALPVNAMGVARLQLGTAPAAGTQSAAVPAITAPAHSSAALNSPVNRHRAVLNHSAQPDVVAPITSAALSVSASVTSEASHAP
jgi:cytoskeleton protein RodZ